MPLPGFRGCARSYCQFLKNVYIRWIASFPEMSNGRMDEASEGIESTAKGLAAGAALGLLIGLVTNSLAWGLIVGTALGSLLGSAWGYLRARKEEEQAT